MSNSTFSQPKSKNKPKYQVKYLVGAGIILTAIIGLVIFGLTQTGQWAVNLAELKAKGSAAIGQGVRVSGQLEANSVEKDIPANKIAFVLTDGTNRLPVSYHGVVPDTFERAVEVVAEGKLNPDGSFTATNVLARCPSKYDESKLEWYDSNQSGTVNYGQ
jgi:cytochrome c-type biogenesis protein CcmE